MRSGVAWFGSAFHLRKRMIPASLASTTARASLPAPNFVSGAMVCSGEDASCRFTPVAASQWLDKLRVATYNTRVGLQSLPQISFQTKRRVSKNPGERCPPPSHKLGKPHVPGEGCRSGKCLNAGNTSISRRGRHSATRAKGDALMSKSARTERDSSETATG